MCMCIRFLVQMIRSSCCEGGGVCMYVDAVTLYLLCLCTYDWKQSLTKCVKKVQQERERTSNSNGNEFE